ncbi:DUF4268 domain-containing protein [Lacibacter sp.]|uniref:DUF4268 domain-containing protein n=1 Tax=Lacibacter sp. TaxID=1915409 RepID=UPI002B4AC09D|nr:DUF4268 domain-containing protein [Lacibacter sp.]HLP38206.1 DUF4268 domain-containing protein [Lacibacter sp.]
MFVIDSKTNSIQSLARKSFSELGFKERANLQEWIAGNPESLGEKLLIIQKEFSGFNETNERLDLLALDKEGNLVVIENKLDDSGRDVTWQALKYAAYCSTLNKEQIEEIFQAYLNASGTDLVAAQVLEDFFDETPYHEININKSSKQRVILIAANFRKEVTSTVLWLMNFKIRLQCFKATPFEFNGQYFLSLDQIIPTKDAQDYVISMTNKAQEEISTEDEVKTRHKIRLKFWAAFLKEIKGKSSLYQNSNPVKDHWLVAGGTGITYVNYTCTLTKSDAAVQLNFGRSSQVENKLLFDSLYKHKSAIEAAFGEELIWEKMEEKKSSRVSIYKAGLNYFNEDDWPAIISFLIDKLNKMEKAVKPYFTEIKLILQQSVKDIQEPLEEE